MKKIIVTGGAGYIGSHTVVELWKSGYTPIIVDNFSNTTKDNIKGIESIIATGIKYYNVDCADVSALYDVFKDVGEGIAGVIHFAAFKSVGESVKNPSKYFKNNVGSLESLMDVMSTFKVNNLIFSSSCSVYGNADKLPVTESTPFKPAESPYAETKQICENIINESIKINSVALTDFNPIGSHESALIGDRSNDKPSNLVPVITTALKYGNGITVYGDDYETIDGTCIRDYIHVVDLAKSHVSALKYINSREGKYVFNVGTGKGVSVLEAIKSFEEATGERIDYTIGDRREGDVVEVYSDCSLIEKEFKWFAEKTLGDCMKDSWNWEMNRRM